MSGLSYLIKEGLKNVWSNRMMSVASICVLISCLVLTGAAELFSMNVEQAVASVGETNETTIYLKDDISDLEALYVGKNLEKLDNISSIRFYSKEEAIKNYKDTLPEEVFANLQGNDNPLPDSYIIAMEDLSKYDITISKVIAIDGVESINNRSELARKLTKISELVSSISLLIVIALAIISLVIIANTIRATMHSRRYEISIMKSVGATNGFVRIPFIIEGMVIGCISAVLATFALDFIYTGIMSAVHEFVHLRTIPFTSVLADVLGIFIVAGAIIGAFGSFISITKYLKKEGNEILGW